MKLSHLSDQQFNGFSIPVTMLLACSLLALISCEQANVNKEVKPLVTIQNLQTAYARACQHSKMYALFVRQAEKEHNKKIAGLFRALSRSEEIRAANHAASLLRNGMEAVPPKSENVVVGTVEQTLKMAMNSEDLQGSKMYPDMITTAEAEHDTGDVRQFTMAKGIDARHYELIFEAINNIGDIAKAQFTICSGCGYVFASGPEDDCPVCHASKNMIEKL